MIAAGLPLVIGSSGPPTPTAHPAKTHNATALNCLVIPTTRIPVFTLCTAHAPPWFAIPPANQGCGASSAAHGAFRKGRLGSLDHRTHTVNHSQLQGSLIWTTTTKPTS